MINAFAPTDGQIVAPQIYPPPPQTAAMNTTSRSKFCLMICFLTVLVGAGEWCLAEEPSSVAVEPVAVEPVAVEPVAVEPVAVEPVPAAPVTSIGVEIEAPRPHRFLDRKNRVLFAVTAGMGMADFAVTRANLQNGGRELNPLVRPFAHNTAALAANFVSQSVATVGLSYLFHKTGHHRLERIAPLLNIGASTAAVTYGLTHR